MNVSDSSSQFTDNSRIRFPSRDIHDPAPLSGATTDLRRISGCPSKADPSPVLAARIQIKRRPREPNQPARRRVMPRKAMAIVESLQLLCSQTLLAKRLVVQLNAKISIVRGLDQNPQNFMGISFATVSGRDPDAAKDKSFVFKGMLDIGHIVMSIAVIGSLLGIARAAAEPRDIRDFRENSVIFLFWAAL